jgi:hypothetical protein
VIREQGRKIKLTRLRELDALEQKMPRCLKDERSLEDLTLHVSYA